MSQSLCVCPAWQYDYLGSSAKFGYIQYSDQCQYLGNCPPSPNPILTLNCYQLTVVELGEGKVGSYSDTDIDPNILLIYSNDPSLSPYLQNNNIVQNKFKPFTLIIKHFVCTVWHLFFSSRIFLDWTLLIKNFHYYLTGTYQSEATWNILKHSLPIKCTAWSILLPIKISNCCSDSYFILQQIAYAFLLSPHTYIH